MVADPGLRRVAGQTCPSPWSEALRYAVWSPAGARDPGGGVNRHRAGRLRVPASALGAARLRQAPARLGELGEAGVSIRALAAFTGEGRGVVHLLLDDQAVAGCRAALGRAGIGIADEREVLVVEDRPMALGELTRQLADANVNVELAYTTFGGVKIVIATDDLESARAALQ